MKICELCEREVSGTTKHHLIPRTNHKNKWFRKNFTRDQLNETVNLCRLCHKEIHKFIPEKEMGKAFNTLEKLNEHPKVIKFLVWIQKQSRERLR